MNDCRHACMLVFASPTLGIRDQSHLNPIQNTVVEAHRLIFGVHNDGVEHDGVEKIGHMT